MEDVRTGEAGHRCARLAHHFATDVHRVNLAEKPRERPRHATRAAPDFSVMVIDVEVRDVKHLNRIIAERGDKSCASIAPRLAADIYGLDILAEDVEDETHNTTRFVVLAREADWAKQGSGPLVTTFVFRVRNLPAALYKAMGGFATNGVNMTKLESYMVDGNFFATQFYADVDGHPDDKGLAFALEELKFFSREFRIVGVYPAHPFRATFSEKME